MLNGKDLFEYCAERMGCDYISDLHFLGKAEKARLSYVIEDVPEDDATLFQWNDAYSYLTGSTAVFKRAGEAKRQLINNLR